jgi:hypothetical protein
MLQITPVDTPGITMNADKPPVDEFALLDATAQAALVRSGDVSALELVDAAIARIERGNPTLNAVIHPRFEVAAAHREDLLLRTAAELEVAMPWSTAPVVPRG